MGARRGSTERSHMEGGKLVVDRLILRSLCGVGRPTLTRAGGTAEVVAGARQGGVPVTVSGRRRHPRLTGRLPLL
jgi:hypothetical protein